MFLLVFLILYSSPSLSETKVIGKHKFWTAYVNSDKNNKTCFIASEPKNQKVSMIKVIEVKLMFL